MSPDSVHRVRIERRSDALFADGDLLGAPGWVVTGAEVVRDAGPEVSLRAPGAGGAGAAGTGAGAPVAAEVVEVRGDDGLALLAVAAPGFAVPPPAAAEGSR